MREIRQVFARFFNDKKGNIAIMAAAAAPLMLCTLALGIDFANLSLQRRSLQKDVDLASISAASRITEAELAVLQHFQMNGKNIAVRTGNELLTLNGKVRFNSDTVFKNHDGYAEVVKGRYLPDPAVAIDKRFVAGSAPYDAVKVTIVEKSQLLFASSFQTAPHLYVVGTASSHKLAAFSVGSRLASLNGGLLNSLLGGLLGTKISLSVMDYNALLDADINALRLADSLGLELGLTAGTYDDVLKTKITYGRFLGALTKTTGVAPTVATVLRQLQQTLNTTQVKFALEDIVNLDPFRQKLIGTGDSLLVNASIFDLVTASATAANKGKQIGIDLGVPLPGLASARLTVAIGEPPVGTPMLAAGRPGSIVRTSQTRIGLVVSVDGLSAIAGLKVTLPLYINVANAEAKLANIRCMGNTRDNASVDIAVVPSVAEIILGNVDETAFANFGTKPRATPSAIVDSALLKITALGHVDITNINPTTLTFSPSEIAYGTVKSVSTRNTLTTLVSSLLGDLDVNINILFISLGTPKAIQNALVETLTKVTSPLDTVVYNVLLMLGVKIGEADVRVTGVSCQRPVLVN